MKIAIIANSSSGLFNFRRDLISRMINDGHEVIALIPLEDRVDQLNQMGIRLIDTPMDRRGMNPLSDFALLQQYKKIIAKEKPDLVITYTIKPNVYGGLICKVLHIPYAANITGLGTAFESSTVLRKMAIWMNRLALSKAKCVFFENSENMRVFQQLHIIKNAQGVLLNGAGVNTEYFNYQEYPEDKGDIRFLFMGRMMKEKGVDELLSAMKSLIKKGYKCSLDILGNYEEQYADIIKAYEKEGWLRYHGYQKDVRPYIANSHCFVLPSWHEGMANTNLEAAATGRPVITSNIPGCKEAVIDGISGFLCDVKNSDELYQKMEIFLQLSENEKIEMGKAGREHVKKEFEKERVVNNTLRYLY